MINKKKDDEMEMMRRKWKKRKIQKSTLERHQIFGGIRRGNGRKSGRY